MPTMSEQQLDTARRRVAGALWKTAMYSAHQLWFRVEGKLFIFTSATSMKASTTVASRLKRALAESDDEVFLRAEFAGLGSTAQVGRALRSLMANGVLVRLGLGVYAKAKRSILSGAPIPIKPVEMLATAALRKLGVEVAPRQATQAYNNGSTTQLPAGIVLNTGRRRISRKLGFGNQVVSYETPRRLRST